MRTRELSNIAYEVADLASVIGLAQNYINCLQLEASKAKNSNNRYLILCSLINERGLDNIMGNLDIMSKKIDSLSNELLDYEDAIK